MKSTIEELWYGNITPCENCGVKDTEIERLVKLMGEHEDKLRNELAEQHRLLFQQYVKWSDRYACDISAQAFRDGFCLAAKLIVETLVGG